MLNDHRRSGPQPHPCAQHDKMSSPHRRHWLLARLAGLFALIWFLVRVVPKPSRAAYPCQRAAAPVAAGFVLWLLSALSAVTALAFWRGVRRQLHRARWGLAALLLAGAVLAASVAVVSLPAPAVRAAYTPSEPPNSPIGHAIGLNPGRVAWIHDPQAATWDGTGHWWEERFTSQERVERMLSQSLRAIAANAPSDREAWQRLFSNFNERHGRGPAVYHLGEKIAVKLNLNQSLNHGDGGNASYTAPQLVLALLRQLVDEVGAAPADITFLDPFREVPSTIYDRCTAEFPGVHFVNYTEGDGREKYISDPGAVIHWSAPMTLAKESGSTATLPTCVTQAAYMINVAGLKGHELGGVTLTAKNQIGTFVALDRGGQPTRNPPVFAGLHPFLAAHEMWGMSERPMGSFNPLVDLMGHRDLGGKTVLYLIDGLYATRHQNEALSLDSRWQSAPFNGHWTASLFAAQDPVAIDSVATDFLRSEPTLEKMVFGHVDNYLHEAAQADVAPSKTIYDPEGDGVPLASLGVHEHWNNAAEKKYSRNLGRGAGIELVPLAP